jgi:hypothetical protein
MMWNRQAPGRLAAVLALAALTLAGCGRPGGSVSGKVTYKGQSLTGGTVTFLGADDRVAWSPIEPDGTYTITRVAPGLAKIGVTPAASSAPPKGMKMMDPAKMDAPAGAAPPAASAGKTVSIPQQYQDPARSGVTYTVTAGSQDYNIELK